MKTGPVWPRPTDSATAVVRQPGGFQFGGKSALLDQRPLRKCSFGILLICRPTCTETTAHNGTCPTTECQNRQGAFQSVKRACCGARGDTNACKTNLAPRLKRTRLRPANCWEQLKSDLFLRVLKFRGEPRISPKEELLSVPSLSPTRYEPP